MPRKTKQAAERLHANRRCRERYGFSLNDARHRTICAMIHEGSRECVFLERQSLRISLFAVFLEEAWLPVVYDRVRKTVVTVLPDVVLNEHSDKLEWRKSA